MRSFTVHPASLALGLVLAAAMFISMAQTTVSTPTRVEYLAHPRDMVQIRGGTPYTVPAGKLLAITALGSVGQAPYDPRLLINGVAEVYAYSAASADSSSMKALPVGLTAPAGSTVEVGDVQAGPPQQYRAWGYLVNQ